MTAFTRSRVVNCLHGQSIKTRVEAFSSSGAAPLPSVYTDNPLKQGLKPQRCRVCVLGDVVYTDNPLKQGLKLLEKRVKGLVAVVYTDNPLKQGLKHDAQLDVAGALASTRTIH